MKCYNIDIDRYQVYPYIMQRIFKTTIITLVFT